MRKGFITLVELTRFGHGPVLAHERTLAGPKLDRLNLMRACDAHLELVFGLFSDPDRRWETIVDPARGEPVWQASFDGVEHTLWRVHEPAAVEQLTALLADRNIYIADGHHRYETMCTFRDELEARGVPDAAYGMIYLSNLDDPGLVVLPTHRLVHGLGTVDLGAVLSAVEPWFAVEWIDLPGDAAGLRARLQAAGAERAALGLSVPGSAKVALLRLREDFDPAAAGLGGLAPALQRLDVVLLHELVLEGALGISKAAQEAKTNLRYEKSSDDALALAAAGDPEVQLVLLHERDPGGGRQGGVRQRRGHAAKEHVLPSEDPGGLVFFDLQPDGR